MTTQVPPDLINVEVQTFNIQFLLPVGSADTFTILQSAAFPFTIDKVTYQSSAGGLTADVKVEGTSVTGLGALSITTTEGSTTVAGSPAVDNDVAIGDKITVVTSGGSPAAATMVSICLECSKVIG